MIHHPFPLLAAYADTIDVVLCTKTDDIGSDADLAECLGSNALVSTKQVHGDHSIIVHAPQSRTEEADGCMSDTPALWLTTRSADCQSFVVFSPEKRTIGVLHAGWKGLVCGAIPSFFASLQRQFAVSPADVRVGIGPSLCKQCAEFTDPAAELPGLDPRFFHGRHADLQDIATDQLLRCGVETNHMDRSTHCTRCENHDFWSYRGGDREAVRAGKTNVLACRLRPS